jgi:hypothetical protein
MSQALVLCEGPTDESFVTEFSRVKGMGHLRVIALKEKLKSDMLPCKPPIRGWTGFAQRLDALSDLNQIEDARAMVLIADSDEDALIQFNKIREKVLALESYNISGGPWTSAPRGTLPPVHVVTLPSRRGPGCLETLCGIALENRDPALKKCADGFIGHLDSSRWSVCKMAKLRLRIQLAASSPTDPTIPFEKIWRDEHDNQRNLIPLSDPCFDDLAKYLAAL